MKGVFIYNKKIGDKPTGIDKKVLWQVEALTSQGLDCQLLELYDKHCGKIGKLLGMILARLPFGNAEPKVTWNKQYKGIDFLYFRRPDAMSFAWLSLLKKIKEENPQIKIIMEIPNYPYDDELSYKLVNKFLLIKDKMYRNKLKLYVDRIAVQNDVSEIFGIKTIVFTNGIKIDDIEIRKPKKKDDDCINICAVASLEPWQGYERIIKGLNQYRQKNGNRKIKVNIIGSGSEKTKYEELIRSYDLTNSINLLGRMSGKELDKYYNEADLALDAFGRYKTGNMLSTSLKSREYLAKGLPIITGCKTDVLVEGFPYFLEVENNDSDVDFNKIVEFYDCIYANGKSAEGIAADIRQYARTTCDISVMVEPVVSYIRG